MSEHWYYQLLWQLQRISEKLGQVGRLAVALLILLALFYSLLVLPKQSLLKQLNLIETTPSVKIADPSAQKLTALNTFKQHFPPLEQRSNTVNQLMAMTKHHGLQLDNINYRTVQKMHDAFHHYFVEFSFDSSYPVAHDYLSDVLSQLPFVSIEQLNMKRNTAWQDEITTSVKLGLHFTQPELAHKQIDTGAFQ